MYAAAAVAVLAVLPSALAVCGSSAGIPLLDQDCPWPYKGPYKIDGSDGPRGIQTGINICNSTTQNQDSLCVNAVANSPSDFCLYGPPALNTIAQDEGETVAYCTKTGYGTRLIPGNTITGLQVVKTPGYVAFAGFMDQTLINITAGDSGGELDPHGADQRGNPLGGLMYSNAFNGGGSNLQQIIEWHMFVGSNTFCFKICDPSYKDPNGNLCENSHDTIGCGGNVPLNYNAINGTFSYCQGDNQQVPNGSVLPIPATSSCTSFASTALFTNAAIATSTSSSAPSSASTTAAPTSTGSNGSSASPSGSQRPSGDAKALGVDRFTVIGMAFSAVAVLVGAGAVML